MLALLGSLLGFAGSLLPDILATFRDKKDKAHELAILRLQMEMAEKKRSNRLEEIRAAADASESQYIYKFAAKSGSPAMDALSTSVRPVLSYAFFFLYASLKISTFLLLYRSSHNFAVSAIQVWSEEDQAIFCAIISFWFGHRSFSRRK